ncbi:hypothetical protein AAMO2058_001077500 [Amorphochlora amoebiformis]
MGNILKKQSHESDPEALAKFPLNQEFTEKTVTGADDKHRKNKLKVKFSQKSKNSGVGLRAQCGSLLSCDGKLDGQIVVQDGHFFYTGQRTDSHGNHTSYRSMKKVHTPRPNTRIERATSFEEDILSIFYSAKWQWNKATKELIVTGENGVRIVLCPET